MKWQGLGAAIGTAVATLVGNVFLMNRYYYKHIGLNIPGFWRHISHLLPAMVLPPPWRCCWRCSSIPPPTGS